MAAIEFGVLCPYCGNEFRVKPSVEMVEVDRLHDSRTTELTLTFSRESIRHGCKGAEELPPGETSKRARDA